MLTSTRSADSEPEAHYQLTDTLKGMNFGLSLNADTMFKVLTIFVCFVAFLIILSEILDCDLDGMDEIIDTYWQLVLKVLPNES